MGRRAEQETNGITITVISRRRGRLDGPRGHHRRDGAGVAREQREEAPPREPEPAQRTVEHDRRAGEVARVLERADDQEEDEDLRHEGEERADAGEHRVLHEVVGEAGREQAADERSRSPRSPSFTSAISGAAQVKMAWKSTAITSAKTGRPSQVERKTRSSRSCELEEHVVPGAVRPA